MPQTQNALTRLILEKPIGNNYIIPPTVKMIASALRNRFFSIVELELVKLSTCLRRLSSIGARSAEAGKALGPAWMMDDEGGFSPGG